MTTWCWVCATAILGRRPCQAAKPRSRGPSTLRGGAARRSGTFLSLDSGVGVPLVFTNTHPEVAPLTFFPIWAVSFHCAPLNFHPFHHGVFERADHLGKHAAVLLVLGLCFSQMRRAWRRVSQGWGLGQDVGPTTGFPTGNFGVLHERGGNPCASQAGFLSLAPASKYLSY